MYFHTIISSVNKWNIFQKVWKRCIRWVVRAKPRVANSGAAGACELNWHFFQITNSFFLFSNFELEHVKLFFDLVVWKNTNWLKSGAIFSGITYVCWVSLKLCNRRAPWSRRIAETRPSELIWHSDFVIHSST